MRLTDGIAIVGMACRYADATTPAELWQTVLARRRAFRRIPDERLPLRDYYSAAPGAADRTYAAEAAVLEGWSFDRVAFRVAGTTFRSADLAHWLALEVAARALADAGHADGAGLPRATTGVHVGNTLTGEISRSQSLRLRWPYVRRVVNRALLERGWDADARRELLETLEADYKAPFAEVGEETLAGGLSNTIAGRICNHFDLKGGGYTVDGACAASLLAVITSCSALAAGDLDVAIAGGVDLSLDPFELVGFAKTGALAPGPMRVYDTRSSGFLPGEGCGMVVLMRHEDAIAAGRRVYAVLRGWGVSSDGSGGITRPEPEGQRLALERAYRRAGYGIDTVAYFEGHGTGTAVGDATELHVLTTAREEAGARTRAAIGSIKANLGHTKAAAGIAGLLKATLAVHHRVLPPTTGCDDPHAALTSSRATLRVTETAEPWPAGVPVRAAVSAMGFGGIDAHVTLEGPLATNVGPLSADDARLSRSSQDAELFVFAGADVALVRAQVERVIVVGARASHAELADVARALVDRLPPAPGRAVRAAVVAANPRELADRLAILRDALAAGDLERSVTFPGVALGRNLPAPRIGFLFPGQGSPSHRSGGALRRRFAAVDALYDEAELSGDPEDHSTRTAQPAIVTSSLAALHLLQALGLEAAAAVGHSLGELTAFHWAGALDARALLRLAKERGRLMADLGRSDGAMAGIASDPATVEGLLVHEPEVTVAGYNSPRQTVVSGEAGAIERVVSRARAAGLGASRLPVSHAFHSPLVAAALPGLALALAAEDWRAPRRAIYSTITGARLEANPDPARLLRDQVTSPVRFAPALAAAAGEVDLWIEVGPGRVLTSLAADSGAAPAFALDAGGPSLTAFLEAVGAAWARGAALEPAALFADRFTRAFDLDRQPVFITNPCETVVDPAERDREDPQPVRGESAPVALDSSPGEQVAPLELVRELICTRAELPPAAVLEGSRLLGDLHLNSISVGEILVLAARRLRVSPPAAPTDYARATVGEIASALAARVAMGDRAASAASLAHPPGVAAWVRAFTPTWSPRPLPARAPALGTSAWEVLAEEDDEFATRLTAALARLPGEPGVLLYLSGPPDERQLPLLIGASRAVIARQGRLRFLLVQRRYGGASFARTLHAEYPEATVCVVTLTGDHPRTVDWVLQELAFASGFVEARYDADGNRFEPALVLTEPTASAGPPALVPSDVLLVTGGGKGIAAEAALALARVSGARLLILGRSSPARDPELVENLVRMRNAGLTVRYAIADVTDPVAVRTAIDEGVRDLGAVTAVLHGAGRNEPRLLETMAVEDFRRTLAPKLDGARHVLEAIDPERLRWFVAFGSVIARTGLRGEADYGLANEWLSLWIEDLQARLPACRCLSVEWSVWSGVGMGQRLGRVDALAEAGVSALPVDDAVAMLARLVPVRAPGPVVVVSGRLGSLPAVFPAESLPVLRFLETPRVHVPGVELVVDSRLSPDRDPYLADHVFRGERIVPAVMVMEAMAQATSALGRWRDLEFEDLEFLQPLVAPAEAPLVLRVAALVMAADRIELVVRSSATDFQVDHVQATSRPRAERREGGAHRAARVDHASADLARTLDPARDLYGGVLFHAGRFRRLGGYRALRATECEAELLPDGAALWFGDHLPERLLLGDPAARDAALHSIQACVPHRVILPVAVRRVRCAALDARGAYSAHAVERARSADAFVFDLYVRDRDGVEVERWEGLRLAVVRGEPTLVPSVPALLGTYVERRLGDLIPRARLRVAIANGGGTREARSDAASRELLSGGRPERRPDGHPVLASGEGFSLAHAGVLTLAVSGPDATACDVQAIESREPATWTGLLGATYDALARELARDGEDASVAATRAWCAAECLKKRGSPPDAPLGIASRHEDGWVVLHSGSHAVATLVTRASADVPALVLAVLGTRATPSCTGSAA